MEWLRIKCITRSKDAKRKITRRSPELEALIQEINSYLAGDEKKETDE
jgi:hypothetical protein